MIVFIDGENLRHRLKDILIDKKYIDKTEDSFAFQLSGLLENRLGRKPDQIIYYTTKLRKPDRSLPKRVQNNFEAIRIANRSWLSRLQNQGIEVVKAGYLNIRETNKCLYCGKTTLTPQEKGVDVRLAIDILQAAVIQKKKEIVVISSDTDLLPAFRVISSTKTDLFYMAINDHINRALSGEATKTIVISKDDIIKAHTGTQK